MTKPRLLPLATALLLLAAPLAHATFLADFTYDFTKSANTYTFTVNVANASTAADTALLDVFRVDLDLGDPTLYSSLSWINGKGWTTDAFEDDGSFGGLPGSFTAFNTGGGIAQGGRVDGFKFKFDYAGALNLAQNPFHGYAWFGTDDNGMPLGTAGMDASAGIPTQALRYVPTGPINPVPEPGTAILLGSGLAGLALTARRKNGKG